MLEKKLIRHVPGQRSHEKEFLCQKAHQGAGRAIKALPRPAAHADRVVADAGLARERGPPGARDRQRRLRPRSTEEPGQRRAGDAEAKLTELDFEVTRVENLKRARIWPTVNGFVAGVRAGDEVVVFYAGHGVQVDGVNYLPAVDAQISSEEDVPLNSLNVDTLLARLDAAKAGIKLIFLDACRDNPYARSFRSGHRGLARMSAAPSGTLIHFATRPGGVAADGKGSNGLYTRQLVRFLDTPGLPVELMLKRVAAAVEKDSRGAQEPWVEGSIKGNFYFRPGAGPQLATIEVEPGGGGVDFGDLERLRREREAVRASLSAWQARMEADFARAEAFSDAKLSVEAWSRFLSGYKEDNPYSGEDERLRREAVARRARAQARLAGAGNESLGGAMVRIEPGCFQMGSPPSEDGRYDNERRHRVCIERAFAIGKHEVTVGQFRRFVTDTGYRSDAERDAGGNSGCYAYQGGSDFGWTEGSSWREPGFSQGEDHPVLCVSWNDAMAYVAWLNGRAGGGYRLPTEAEWEYAARGGSQSAYTFGPDAGALCRYANVADHRAKQRFTGWTIAPCDDGHVFTAPVGAFGANPWGLHDVHGNVWEWTCSDYDKDYSGGEQGCADAAAHYATRGGCWLNSPRSARSADRNWNSPGYRCGILGFRLARTLP